MASQSPGSLTATVYGDKISRMRGQVKLGLESLGVKFVTANQRGLVDSPINRHLKKSTFECRPEASRLIRTMAKLAKSQSRELGIFHEEEGDEIIGIGFHLDRTDITHHFGDYFVTSEGGLSTLSHGRFSGLSPVGHKEFHKAFKHFLKYGSDTVEWDARGSVEALRLISKGHERQR